MTETVGSHSGKVAFVTGAGSGIGRATAIAFARAGASVAAVDLSETGLADTVAQAGRTDGRILPIVCDVTDSVQVRAAVDRTVETLGGLHAAFNNAGIEQRGAPIADLDEETFDRVMTVNLRSVFLCMKYQIRWMLENGGGAIVNTSSGAGVLAMRNLSAYSASKFGVTAISKAAALEYADRGIRVNALCPGIIDTPMIARYTNDTDEGRAKFIVQEPVGRMGRPEEMADTVLWLCSDKAGFITGHAMVADGGQTAGLPPVD